MSSRSTVHDCLIKKIETVRNSFGCVSALTSFDTVPFSIERIYYLYDVPYGAERGEHGHKELEQYFIAVSGSFIVILKDGKKEKSFSLNRPNEALYVAPGMWRQLKSFSVGSACLVLASKPFSEKDYIRNYREFLEYKKGAFT